jgi:lipoprotein-releasing system permease protein
MKDQTTSLVRNLLQNLDEHNKKKALQNCGDQQEIHGQESQNIVPDKGKGKGKGKDSIRCQRILGVEWAIASRYLFSRRREKFVSVIVGFSFLGIALGVATLIVVMAVMNGFREELVNRILGTNGHFTVLSYDGSIRNYDALAKKLGNIPGVINVFPIVEGQAIATDGSSNARGVLVRGMRSEDLQALTIVAQPEESWGNISSVWESNAIAVGAGAAQALRLMVEDKMTLVAPHGQVTPFGMIPRMKSYDIGYIFRIGMSEYDKVLVYMPFYESQIFFNREDTADYIEIRVKDPLRVTFYRNAIQDALDDVVQVSDWQAANASFMSALDIEKNVMVFIMMLIVLIAALNIVSGLIILVRDKARDIAILRTMGLTQGSVVRIFIMCGAFVGVLGTLAGFVLGILFCVRIDSIQQFLSSIMGVELFSSEVYFLSHLPVRLIYTDVVAVVVMALLLSLLATLYPSWRAGKQDPLVALRNV